MKTAPLLSFITIRKQCACHIPVLEFDTVVATRVELGVQLGYLVGVTGINKVEVMV